MDSLDIKALSVNTHIGINQWEQRILQPLFIDIHIPSDFSAYADSIDNAIDYDRVCQEVTHFIESNNFNLIETVANKVAELLKHTFQINQLVVSVSKPHAIKNAGDIRVTVSR